MHRFLLFPLMCVFIPSVSSWGEKQSKTLRRVLTRMLQLDPSDRFYNASAALQYLEARPKAFESNNSDLRSGVVLPIANVRAGEGDMFISPPRNSKIKTIDTGVSRTTWQLY